MTKWEELSLLGGGWATSKWHVWRATMGKHLRGHRYKKVGEYNYAGLNGPIMIHEYSNTISGEINAKDE